LEKGKKNKREKEEEWERGRILKRKNGRRRITVSERERKSEREGELLKKMGEGREE
jgi:hypothetical protein